MDLCRDVNVSQWRWWFPNLFYSFAKEKKISKNKIDSLKKMLRVIAIEMVVTKFFLSPCGGSFTTRCRQLHKNAFKFFFLLLQHLLIFNVDSVFKRLYVEAARLAFIFGDMRNRRIKGVVEQKKRAKWNLARMCSGFLCGKHLQITNCTESPPISIHSGDSHTKYTLAYHRI